MVLDKEITEILNKTTPDLLEWSILLNYFHDNQKKLSFYQKIRLFRKNQKILKYWNTDRTRIVEIVRPSGDLMKISSLDAGLGIKEEDIEPNTIYQDRDIIRYRTFSISDLLTITTRRLTIIKSYISVFRSIPFMAVKKG